MSIAFLFGYNRNGEFVLWVIRILSFMEDVEYGKEALPAAWWLGSFPVAPRTEAGLPGPDRSEKKGFHEA